MGCRASRSISRDGEENGGRTWAGGFEHGGGGGGSWNEPVL